MNPETGKKLNRIIVILYLAGCVAISVYLFVTKGERLILSFLSPLFLLIPLILQKLFKLKPYYVLNNIMYVFFFLAYCIGVTCGLFKESTVYDKICHLFSGILFASIGAYIFSMLNSSTGFLSFRKKDGRLFTPGEAATMITFSCLFAMACEYLWEFYEYFYDMATGEDCQWVALTGVGDTMQDMIFTFSGAILLVILLVFLYKKTKKKTSNHSS